MRKLALALALLTVIVAYPIYSIPAQLPCTIDVNGVATCAGSITPPNPADPAPVPLPPQPTPTPTSCPGVNPNAYPFMDQPGHNTHTYNYTQGGTTVTWRIRTTGPGGEPIHGGFIQFASEPSYNPIGATYEVSISKCPGDFTTYKQQTPTQGYYSCGGPPAAEVGSFNFQQAWSPSQSFSVCGIPENEQWYLNWRCTRGLNGERCGQTFYWSRTE
jgi:hypothetical protein